MRVVAGELPDFPYLPELPDRGPGADLTGRTAALLVDMPAEVTPRGWRLAERPGRDVARARSMLASDLDVLEEVLQGFEGPLKIQLCGPWTLAATLELTRTMNKALADPGAVADLTASLAEGAAAYAADVAKRVPGGKLVVQFDEPALPSVVEGLVPSAHLMEGIGLVALAANTACLLLLSRHRADDVNMRSAWICSRNDVIANGGVLLAALAVAVSGSVWPDIVMGLVIAAIFGTSAVGVIRQARRAWPTARSASRTACNPRSAPLASSEIGNPYPPIRSSRPLTRAKPMLPVPSTTMPPSRPLCAPRHATWASLA